VQLHANADIHQPQDVPSLLQDGKQYDQPEKMKLNWRDPVKLYDLPCHIDQDWHHFQPNIPQYPNVQRMRQYVKLFDRSKKKRQW
jgi:hypothetical protein